MASSDVAVIVGVGPGLGAALCRRFVKAGLLVAAVARDKDRVTTIAKELGARGYGCDATDEKSVIELFAAVKRDFGEPALVVYNAGAFLPRSVIETEAAEFERCWRIGCFGGFLVGREAARAMTPRTRGTILFTGATASLRGGANFANLAVGKFGLRALAQSMARELGPQGLHVGHVIVDGPIDMPWIRENFPQLVAERPPDGLLAPDDIAESYWMLHRQPRSAWTFELDLRPWVEPW